MSGSSQDVTAHGHIDTTDGGALDVYLDGERMEFMDGYHDAVQLRLDHDDGVTSVFVVAEHEKGISAVEAEHWDDADAAFCEDGEIIDFEYVSDMGSTAFRFEAEGEYDYTVKIREVETFAE